MRPSFSARPRACARSYFLACLLPLSAVGLGSAQDEDADAAQSARVLQLTLDDALRIALENNLDLEIEEITTETAHFNAYGSWGSFDPVFSVTGTASDQEIQGTSSLSGGQVVENDTLSLDSSLAVPFTTGGQLDLSYSRSNDKTNNQFAAFDVSTTDVVTLALTQPLLRGAWRRYATTFQRGQEIAYERQKETLRQVRQQLILDVYNAYWDLVSAREELAVRNLAVELGQRQLQQDERRLEVGTGTEVDVLQSETNAAQQEEARINAEFGLRQAEDNLRRMLFQKPEGEMEDFLAEWDWSVDPLTPLPEVADQALDWQRSLELAVELRPELWQRRLDIDAAEVELEAARTDRRPQLDLNLSTSSVGFDSDPGEALDTALGYEFPNRSASLTFSVPIFNRTARYAERAARASLRQAQLGYDRQELDILAEVRAAVRDVRFRAKAVLAAKKSLDLAERQLEAEEARQEIGLSTTFQVLEFQQTLAEALSAERAARAAYAKSLASLSRSEGRLELEASDAEQE